MWHDTIIASFGLFHFPLKEASMRTKRSPYTVSESCFLAVQGPAGVSFVSAAGFAVSAVAKCVALWDSVFDLIARVYVQRTLRYKGSEA